RPCHVWPASPAPRTAHGPAGVTRSVLDRPAVQARLEVALGLRVETPPPVPAARPAPLPGPGPVRAAAQLPAQLPHVGRKTARPGEDEGERRAEEEPGRGRGERGKQPEAERLEHRARAERPDELH